MAETRYDDPLAYLIAVATGETRGDALRVAAAKAALPFTVPKQRAPVQSPSPQTLRKKSEGAIDAAERGDWHEKANAVRARVAAQKGKK